MSKTNALGRLFPSSLFSILGVVLAVLWRSDPVLMAIGACGAAASVAWLIITTVEVARLLQVEPVLMAGTRGPASPQA
jgi:hypothetical protein